MTTSQTADDLKSLLAQVGLELTPDDVKRTKDAILAIATGHIVKRTETKVLLVVQGQVIKEETTISEHVNPPDWRAAAWILKTYRKVRPGEDGVQDGAEGDAAAT